MSSPPVTVGADDDVDTAIALVTVLHDGDGLDRDESPRPVWTGQLVDAVMSRDPVTAAADETIWSVLDRMGHHGIRHLPVLDGERRVIGVLSDRDVRTAIGNPMQAVASRDAEVRIESTGSVTR